MLHQRHRRSCAPPTPAPEAPLRGSTQAHRAPALERRSFLRGLVTLPLIGGGVTLIGAPAAPVPLARAAALPMLDDPRERARYAWEAFASAMDDLTADASGWCIQTAVSIRPNGLTMGHSFARFGEVHIEKEGDVSGAIFERRREIALDPIEEAVIRAREAFAHG